MQPRGEPTDICFSQVEEKLGYPVSAFIPQISLPQFEYPLLACDISEIDQNLIGWEDSANGMDVHNLIHDVPGLADTKDPLFSLVKQWKMDNSEKDLSVKEESHSISEQQQANVPDSQGREVESKVPLEYIDEGSFSC